LFRAYRKARAIAERDWRRARREAWDRVTICEAAVDALSKRRSRDNRELAKLLDAARARLEEAEERAKRLEGPVKVRKWMTKSRKELTSRGSK
jgi:hypothetical protein